MIVQSERLLTTFLLGSPSLLYPMSQVSSLGVGPEVTSCPRHPFLGCGHLILTGHPSTFMPSFYHEHTILSCPRPGSCIPVFPRGSLLRATRSYVILAQLLPTSLLGFLRCHLLLKSLTHASLNTSFLLRAQNLFFSLHGPGSSLLYF